MSAVVAGYYYIIFVLCVWCAREWGRSHELPMDCWRAIFDD